MSTPLKYSFSDPESRYLVSENDSNYRTERYAGSAETRDGTVVRVGDRVRLKESLLEDIGEYYRGSSTVEILRALIDEGEGTVREIGMMNGLMLLSIRTASGRRGCVQRRWCELLENSPEPVEESKEARPCIRYLRIVD